MALDLKVLRATAECLPITGFHPHEFNNILLTEYIHPSDRHLVESERTQMLAAVQVRGVHSDRNTQAALTRMPNQSLVSPAEGMRTPYPNQNVRVLRSDNNFDWYNVRLHFGGGLGGSLLRQETAGNFYIVGSLLLLPTDTTHIGDDPSRQSIGMVPPTPVTPATAAIAAANAMAAMQAAQSQPAYSSPGQASGNDPLPGFSAIAAAAAEATPSMPLPPPPPQHPPMRSTNNLTTPYAQQMPTSMQQPPPLQTSGRPATMQERHYRIYETPPDQAQRNTGPRASLPYPILPDGNVSLPQQPRTVSGHPAQPRHPEMDRMYQPQQYILTPTQRSREEEYRGGREMPGPMDPRASEAYFGDAHMQTPQTAPPLYPPSLQPGPQAFGQDQARKTSGREANRRTDAQDNAKRAWEL